MINQVEIPMYLDEVLPGIAHDNLMEPQSDPYDAMNKFVSFTCENIRQHNFNTVKKCFQVADKLYNRGNGKVKNAVQNVFVFSLTNIFQRYPSEKKQLLALLPVTLYSLYISQIYHSGC